MKIKLYISNNLWSFIILFIIFIIFLYIKIYIYKKIGSFNYYYTRGHGLEPGTIAPLVAPTEPALVSYGQTNASDILDSGNERISNN